MKIIRFGVFLEKNQLQRFGRLIRRKKYPNRSDALTVMSGVPYGTLRMRRVG